MHNCILPVRLIGENTILLNIVITIPSQQASVHPVQWRSGGPLGGNLGVRTRDRGRATYTWERRRGRRQVPGNRYAHVICQAQ